MVPSEDPVTTSMKSVWLNCTVPDTPFTVPVNVFVPWHAPRPVGGTTHESSIRNWPWKVPESVPPAVKSKNVTTHPHGGAKRKLYGSKLVVTDVPLASNRCPAAVATFVAISAMARDRGTAIRVPTSTRRLF